MTPDVLPACGACALPQEMLLQANKAEDMPAGSQARVHQQIQADRALKTLGSLVLFVFGKFGEV